MIQRERVKMIEGKIGAKEMVRGRTQEGKNEARVIIGKGKKGVGVYTGSREN